MGTLLAQGQATVASQLASTHEAATGGSRTVFFSAESIW